MIEEPAITDFKQILKLHPVVIAYFSTPDCNVCKVLRPKVKELVQGYQMVKFIYIDTTEQPALAGQYIVFTVPTIILFVEEKESKRFSRSFSLSEIKGFLDRITSMLS